MRLAQRGEFKITERGGVKFWVFGGVEWYMWEHDCPFFVDSLGLMVVFKWSMMTSSVWGNIATYFWGLLGVDGCIQMVDDDR